MLYYLGNLMDDASGFSWDSAKTCHPIVLTNMEAHRISWHKSDKLDQIRRAHDQGHITPSHASVSCSFVKKSKNTQSKNAMVFSTRHMQAALTSRNSWSVI